MSKRRTSQTELTQEAGTAGAAENREAPAAPVGGRKKAGGALVYCGPTVRGVAKRYTVYSGGIPEELAHFIQEHPAAAGLVVPVERFAQMRRKMETAGTAEAILYQKIKTEL